MSRGYNAKGTKMQNKTTHRRLNDRAQAFVDSLPESDPLVRANKMIDRANDAIESGDFELADELFELAEAMLR